MNSLRLVIDSTKKIWKIQILLGAPENKKLKKRV
jgi:hypothetical protein